MTVKEAIQRANALRPNPFSEQEKFQWLSELDGKIAKEVLKKEDFSPYTYPSDETRELLADSAYTDIYLFYLCAMIDFFSRDYGEYNNSMLLFNTLFEQYAKGCATSLYGEKENGEISHKYYINIF